MFVGKAESIDLPVLYGAHQGLTLGLLFFLSFFIYDLMVDKRSIQCRFFADDCILVSQIACVSYQKCLDDNLDYADMLWDPHSQSCVNQLERVQKWFLGTFIIYMAKNHMFHRCTVRPNCLSCHVERK